MAAFAGPGRWTVSPRNFAAPGYRGRNARRCAITTGAKPPDGLGTTSLLDYAADLEQAHRRRWTAPPILVGHSMGGLAGADAGGAAAEIAAAILLAPSAPWGVPPSTLFEIGAAQGLMLQVGFWNTILEPNFDIAAAHSLDRFPQGASATRFSSAWCRNRAAPRSR